MDTDPPRLHQRVNTWCDKIDPSKRTTSEIAGAVACIAVLAVFACGGLIVYGSYIEYQYDIAPWEPPKPPKEGLPPHTGPQQYVPEMIFVSMRRLMFGVAGAFVWIASATLLVLIAGAVVKCCPCLNAYLPYGMRGRAGE